MTDRVAVLGRRVGDIMTIRIPDSEYTLEIHPDNKIVFPIPLVFRNPPKEPKYTKFLLQRSDVINIIDLAKTSWKEQAPQIRRTVGFYAPRALMIGNLLDEWKKKLVLEGLHKKKAARTIQRAYREARNNPEYDMCKKRLMGEFEELKSNFKK